jgi:tetratricopeptide (TPR) repeat protein
MRDFKLSPQTLVHFESGDLEQGLEVAVALLSEARRTPDQDAILQHLQEVAEFAHRIGQVEAAIDARQEMIARHVVLAENRPSAAQVEDLARLGYYYQIAREWKLADEHLLRGIEAIQQLPADQRIEYPNLWFNRCFVVRAQPDLPQALQHLLEAYRMHCRYTRECWDDVFHFQRNYASLMREMGQWPKAAKACRIAFQLADRPDLPRHNNLSISSVHYTRGLIYYHDKDFAQALSSFERAAELLKLAPRRYPINERLASEACAAAIDKLQTKLSLIAI